MVGRMATCPQRQDREMRAMVRRFMVSTLAGIPGPADDAHRFDRGHDGMDARAIDRCNGLSPEAGGDGP